MNRKLNHITIDPGHGGSDPGAVNPVDGLRESDIVLWAGLWLGDVLEARGFSVDFTRVTDERVSLTERCAQANDLGVEAFISLHCNAAEVAEARGFEVWTSPGYTPADDLATEVYRCIRRALPDRKLRVDQADADPDKEARFKVLVGTEMPAVLIELGFITNPAEAELLSSPLFISKTVRAIADAIEEWAAPPSVTVENRADWLP